MDEPHRIGRPWSNPLLVVVREELGLVGGHVDLDGAIALASFARETEIQRLPHVVVAPAARQRLAFEHLEEQPRASAARVLLVVRDAIARAHRAIVLAAALADAYATGRRKRKAAAIVRERGGRRQPPRAGARAAPLGVSD